MRLEERRSTILGVEEIDDGLEEALKSLNDLEDSVLVRIVNEVFYLVKDSHDIFLPYL